MTKTAPEPAHAPARLRRALYGKSMWHLPSPAPVASARWMGRKPRLARGPHTISLGDRPTDRVSHRHFEKQLTKRNERLARRRRRRGGPSPSSVWSSHTRFALRRRRPPTKRQNDGAAAPVADDTDGRSAPFRESNSRRADIMSTKHSSSVHFTLSLFCRAVVTA